MKQTKQWWKEAVVYQVYPRSFQDSNGDGVGDLNGITSRLDYLKELGVDVIWLSPINESPMVDGGYDISDYQAILKEFGTMEDFDRLLDAVHRRGMKLLLDLVVNHTSDQHPWFVESRQSRQSPKRDWYIWRDGFEGSPPNGMRSIFSGSAWEKDAATGQYYMHMFVKEQPDLNWDNPEVRQAVHDMMRWWLDKGVDGFRMDAVSFISKPPEAVAPNGGPPARVAGGPHIHEHFREMRREVLSHYDIMVVGETGMVTPEEALDYAGFDREELNMVFQFDLVELGQGGPYGKFAHCRPTMPEMRAVLNRWQTKLDGAAWNSLYWSNHDQPRSVSRFGDTSTPQLWEKSAKMLATCMYLMQGTPFIFQGEELGMTNTVIDDLADCHDVETHNAYRELVEEKGVYSHGEMMEHIRFVGRDNARTPMQWTAGPGAGFTVGKPWMRVNPNHIYINAEAQTDDPDSIFCYYRNLIRLRREHPVIVYGSYTPLCTDHPAVFAYRREYEGQTLTVICSYSSQPADNPLAEQMEKESVLISNYPRQTGASVLRPYEAFATLR